MRVLRILTSNQLPCGCLTGVYELYSGKVIVIVDALDGSCVTHRLGQQVEEIAQAAEASNQPHAGD